MIVAASTSSPRKLPMSPSGHYRLRVISLPVARRLGLMVLDTIVGTPTRVLERFFSFEIGDECHQCSEYSDAGEVVRMVVHGSVYCHQCDRSHPDGELCNRQIERFCYGCRKWRCLTMFLLCPVNREHDWSESMRRPLRAMRPPPAITWARRRKEA